MTFRDSGAETTEVTARGGVCKGRERGPGGSGGGAAAGRQLRGSFPPPERRLRLAGPALSPGPPRPASGGGVAAHLRTGERCAARGPCARPERNRILPLGGGEPARPASPLRQVL